MNRSINQWFGLAFIASSLLSCVQKSPTVENNSPAKKPDSGSGLPGGPGNGIKPGPGGDPSGPNSKLTAVAEGRISPTVLSAAIPANIQQAALSYTFASNDSGATTTSNTLEKSASSILLGKIQGLTQNKTTKFTLQISANSQPVLCFEDSQMISSLRITVEFSKVVPCSGGSGPNPPGGGGGTKPPANPPGGGGGTKPPANPPGGGGTNPPANPPGNGSDTDVEVQIEMGMSNWKGDKDMGNSAWSIDS